MALTRFLFATSLLLLSLLVIVSASDYGYGTKPEFDKSKSEEGQMPYHEKSSDNGYGTKAVFDKLKSEKKEEPYHEQCSGNCYGTKEVFDKLKSDKKEEQYHEKSSYNGYGTKEVFDKLKSEEKQKSYHEKSSDYGYGTKPELNNLKSEEKEMLYHDKSSDYGYGSKPDLDKPKLEEKEKLVSIGVEGLVLCKSGPKYMPIQGAVTRITCPMVDEHGYETTFSVLSGATDAKGYFFATLCSSELENKLKLTGCKAFLEKCPLETCKYPTDVNKGISGAHLSSYRILKDKKMKLYSIGPLFYTSEAKSTPNGY